jgi:hypothetical protein
MISTSERIKDAKSRGARTDFRCRTELRTASGYRQRDTDRDRQETRQ